MSNLIIINYLLNLIRVIVSTVCILLLLLLLFISVCCDVCLLPKEQDIVCFSLCPLLFLVTVIMDRNHVRYPTLDAPTVLRGHAEITHRCIYPDENLSSMCTSSQGKNKKLWECCILIQKNIIC